MLRLVLVAADGAVTPAARDAATLLPAAAQEESTGILAFHHLGDKDLHLHAEVPVLQIQENTDTGTNNKSSRKEKGRPTDNQSSLVSICSVESQKEN